MVTALASGRSPYGEDQMELCRRRPLALPLSHPLAKCIVFFCYRFVVFQVATRPPLFASFLRVQLALFVAVGVLLPFAHKIDNNARVAILDPGFFVGIPKRLHDLLVLLGDECQWIERSSCKCPTKLTLYFSLFFY